MSDPTQQSPLESDDSPIVETPRSMRSFAWQKRLFWSLISATILIWVIAAISLVWLLSLYRTTLIISRNPGQTTPIIVTATIAPILPTVTVPEIKPTSSPTPPPPVPSPTATPMVVTAAQLLAQAQAALQLAQAGRDRQQAQVALDLLVQAEAMDPTAAPEVAWLRSQLFFTLDALDSTIYLNQENTTRWSLVEPSGTVLLYPIDMTFSDEGIYIIESGALYRGNWPLTTAGGELSLTPILTPSARIGGYPVKEIVAVEATNTSGAIYVLDKSNDLYHYDPISGIWYLETISANQYNNPDPIYLNLGSYDGRLYLLDPARNQIWRHPPRQAEQGFLPGTLPWLVKPGEPDVNAGLDLAIDGQIYVLQRDGVIVAYDPAERLRFSLTAANGICRVPGWADLPIQPSAIFAAVKGTTLYVADSGRRRVVTIDRATGHIIGQFVAPDNLDFTALLAIAEKDGFLYLLAGAHLYRYDLNPGLANLPLPARELPELTPLPSPNLAPSDLSPNDPRLPGLLATYNFTMPLQGALLPDRSAIYPGSRRAYRYGVHEGLDLYGKDIGVDVQIGTPVYAAGAGIILRADIDYQEMTLTEVNSLLDDAHVNRMTSVEALDKLSGRQVWIDHGQGVVTRYAHLSDLADGIIAGQPVSAGQLIGYVGLSGTPDGISGNTQFPHLHFEIRIGPTQQYYLGQWLTIEETRRAFERIFKVPVRPAYLEFREGGDSAQN